jgi:anti-sigma factor RsiW
MSCHETETISGLLDGELKGIRRWKVERHVRACPICAVEYRRQRHVRRLLQAQPSPVQMSDSAEFFWSKVKAEIKHRGPKRTKSPRASLVLPDWLRQYQFAVATAATFAIVALCAFWFSRTPALPGHAALTSPAGPAEVERLKTAIPNTAATVFQSDDSRDTVIWVSGLPWTPNMNAMKTEFANLDT